MRYTGNIRLLLRDMMNPPMLLYYLFHCINHSVPVSLAGRIFRRNISQYKAQGLDDVLLDVKDGGGQTVHPDIDMFDGLMALICTPYPYGMEEYENPCLFIGKDLCCLRQVADPLDVPQERTQGVHLSDPCILADGDKLLCIYRDTRYCDDKIFLKYATKDVSGGFSFSERHLLLEKYGGYALSPAVIMKADRMLMYHVETNKRSSELVMNIYDRDSLEHLDSRILSVNNGPQGYYLWHIGISTSVRFDKVQSESDSLLGLFLYVSEADDNDTRLFSAASSDSESWSVGKEILIPEKLSGIIKFPYKSCMNPRTGKMLLSFRDIKERNRLMECSLHLDI